MDFDEEQRLRAQAAAGGEQARAARRQLAFGEADNRWQAGDRGAAMRLLYNSGYTDDMVDFCRERGLSEADARQVIRGADIDWN